MKMVAGLDPKKISLQGKKKKDFPTFEGEWKVALS